MHYRIFINIEDKAKDINSILSPYKIKSLGFTLLKIFEISKIIDPNLFESCISLLLITFFDDLTK